MQNSQRQQYSNSSDDRLDLDLHLFDKSINTDPRERSRRDNNDMESQVYEEQIPAYALPEARFEYGEKINPYQTPVSTKKPRRKRNWLLVLASLIIIFILMNGIGAFFFFSVKSTSNSRFIAPEINIMAPPDLNEDLWDYQTFQVNDKATLQIDHQVGNITVLAGQGDHVEIHTIVHIDGLEHSTIEPDIEYNQISEDLIKINVNNNSDWINTPQSVFFEVRVPANINLEIHTDKGDITVNDVNGLIDLNTNEGNIDIYNTTLEDGSIVNTDMGNITLTDVILDGAGTINSNSGNVHFIGDLKDNANYTLHTQTGEVIAILSENQTVHITASTNTGEIESEFEEIEINNGTSPVTVDHHLGEKETNTKLDLYTDEGNIEFYSR